MTTATPTAPVTADEAELTRLQSEVDRLTARKAELETEIRATQSRLDSLTVGADDLGAAEQQYTALVGAIGARKAMLRSIEAQRPQLVAQLASAKEQYRSAEWKRLGAEIDRRGELLALDLAALAAEAQAIDALAVKRLQYSHKAHPHHDNLYGGAADTLRGLAGVVSPSKARKLGEDIASGARRLTEIRRKEFEKKQAQWRETQLAQLDSDETGNWA